MSLSGKILVILAVVVVLYTGTDYVLQQMTISRAFVELEEERAARNVQRIVEAISEEKSQLDQLCLSLASWDETWGFVANAEVVREDPKADPQYRRMVERYIGANLDPSRLEREKLDLLYLCASDGTVLWGSIMDPGTRSKLELRDFPAQKIDLRNPLVSRGVIEDDRNGRRTIDSKAGVFLTERGAMLVSSRPILNSRGEGPERGTLIAGRFLGPKLVTVLSQRTRVPFQVWPLDGSVLPESEEALLADVTSSSRPVLAELDEETLYGYTAIEDILRSPGLLVRAEIERSISKMGSASIEYAWVSTLTASLMMMLVLLVLMKTIVLGPITRLSRNAVAIGRDEHSGVKFDTRRNDEIGVLSREFDDMIAKLAKSREALVRTARTAGMSEIATGILHNVGNVLNSVNVSASLLGRRVSSLGVDDLEQLSDVLLEHSDDLSAFVAGDPRGQVLQPFVGAIAENLRAAQSELDAEVVSLSKGIDHIRELVNSQQDYAVGSSLIETVSLSEQLDEALSLADKALSRDPGLRVELELDPLPPLSIDRHKLLEILVNLVQNARQAMARTGAGAHVLRVRARTVDDGRVRIEVEDNGVGIPPENLLAIFNLGFTTKQSGHGVGLHASANAAAELGGSLVAQSSGPGRGATFVLEVPLTRQPQTIAA